MAGERSGAEQRPGCRGPTIWLFNIRLGFLSQFGLLLTVPFQKLFYVLCHWGANRTVRTTGHKPETTAHVVPTLGGKKAPGPAGVCPIKPMAPCLWGQEAGASLELDEQRAEGRTDRGDEALIKPGFLSLRLLHRPTYYKVNRNG